MIVKMIKIKELLTRNPCNECDYYHSENNTCQSKKLATCGNHPYINKFDKMFCEPYRGGVGENHDS